ncbi:hypothetical protein [Ralstonia sp. ASV6]|uniref:hypothetical protein n=1 Tax=Ralstonia sp. ASV6 TaxID=2795124 RepID=UPI0018EC6D26|nr:hypothetical protein [Ralstonia sp. ASV6]
MIGLRGGWLDGRGTVHGAYDAWVLPVAGTAAELKPEGTLVALYGQGELWGSADVSVGKR